MASPKIEPVLKNCCKTCGEGPHWDVPSQSLYYVDIVCGGVARWNSTTGETKRVDLDKQVGFVIPSEKSGVVIGYDKNICRLDLDASDPSLTTLLTVEQDLDTRFNDAKCDASGRLWAGTMGMEGDVPGVVKQGQGSLYSINEDLSFKHHVGGIDISNGMDWTDDNSIMYYIDSVPRKVYAFDFNMADNSLSNQRTVVDFGEGTMEQLGLPDGMCIDCEGKIWVACFSASKVVRFDPQTGKALQEIKMPATNITSVCFGGPNLDELYVTCSRHNMPNPDSQPLAGSIFKVTGLGVKGRAPNNFKG